MWKYLAALLVGGLLGAGVFFVIKRQTPAPSAPTAMSMQQGPNGLAKAKPIDMTGKIDVKNTKCPVSGDDIGSSPLLAEYHGKVYHLCCDDCVEPFNKDPQKYVTEMEANPAHFGIAAATEPSLTH